jgi:hypothetical protein
MRGMGALSSHRRGMRPTIGLLLILGYLPACVEYQIDRQGNLQSLGLPGVPVWQSQSLAEQKRLAAEGDLTTAPGTMVDPTATRFVALSSGAPWLTGVNPIGEHSWLSLGSTQHAQYLVKNGPP